MPRHVLLSFSVGLIALIIYANSLNNSFVWDDHVLIVRNPAIVAEHKITSFIADDVWEPVDQRDPRKFYRPIISLSYYADYRLFGMNPRGFHLTNILVHAYNSILVYFIVLNLFVNPWTSFLASVMFAVHPIHTESVAWISGRTDLFCTFFSLLSILLFIKSRIQKNYPLKDIKIWFSSLFFAFALLSKEPAVVLPAILWLIDYSFGRDKKLMAIIFARRYWLHYLVLVLYLAVRLLLLDIKIPAPAGYPWYKLLFSIPVVLVNYFRLLIFPWNLDAHHPLEAIDKVNDPAGIACLCLLMAFALLSYRFRQSAVILLFSTCWIMVSLIPSLNLGNLGDIILAERYLYLPSVGFCIFAAFLYLEIVSRIRVTYGKIRYFNIMICIPAGALVCLYSYGTYMRNMDWRDDVTLFAQCVRTNPKSAYIHNWLAFGLGNRGDHHAAIEELNSTISNGGASAQVFSNLATAQSALGQYDEAITNSLLAIHQDPEFVQAYVNLGNVCLAKKDFHNAFHAFYIATNLAPDNSMLFLKLGVSLEKLEDYVAAEKAFSKAVELDDSNALAHLNLADLFFHRLSRPEDAALNYRKFLALCPDHPEAKKVRDLILENGG